MFNRYILYIYINIYIQGGLKVGLQLNIQRRVLTVALRLAHPVYLYILMDMFSKNIDGFQGAHGGFNICERNQEGRTLLEFCGAKHL